jgi:hypothetical protein
MRTARSNSTAFAFALALRVARLYEQRFRDLIADAEDRG